MSRNLVLAALLALAPLPALAHVTFEKVEPKLGSSFKGVLRVPHGCAGKPTNVVRVVIPEGVVEVKPQPKPGWTLSATRGAYATPQTVSGKPVTEGVTELVWSGGALGDDQYDEFVFQARIVTAPEGGEVFFPVTQECGTDRAVWTTIPAAGQDPHAVKSPAPGVKVLAQASGGHVGHGAAPAPAADHSGHGAAPAPAADHSGHGAAPAPAADHSGHGAASTAPATETAHVARLGDLVIEQPWTRATPKGAAVAGGYVKITNNGKLADRLLGGSFPGAARVEVHEMAVQDGTMRMRQLADGLTIEPGQSVELKPGGLHLMFLGLTKQVETGAPVKARLRFEKAGEIELDFDVARIGAAAPQEHKH